ncbi:hypothetical protein [Caldimonas sp. KR1-144]|uniref:hypothetical protein n=1 Tax=Caldimonas sp. KR1-144 TaxID=3400911 RepID=UPI003BFC070D
MALLADPLKDLSDADVAALARRAHAQARKAARQADLALRARIAAEVAQARQHVRDFLAQRAAA